MASSRKQLPRAARKNKADDFESVARRLECDEDLGKFDEKLKKIAKVKRARPKK